MQLAIYQAQKRVSKALLTQKDQEKQMKKQIEIKIVFTAATSLFLALALSKFLFAFSRLAKHLIRR